MLLAAVVLGAAAGGMDRSVAMDRPTDPTVTCRGATSDINVPQYLCAAFRERVAAATGSAQGGVTLVVESLSDSRIVARIDAGDTTGESLGVALRDAPLDDGTIARFLDRLVELAAI